jgi:hypothetical protein
MQTIENRNSLNFIVALQESIGVIALTNADSCNSVTETFSTTFCVSTRNVATIIPF